MQVYYFSRTGRSKLIAEKLAKKFDLVAKCIDAHTGWSGKVNYMKVAAMAISGQSIDITYDEVQPADRDIYLVLPLWAGATTPAINTFIKEVDVADITATVTSIGSKLVKRDHLKKSNRFSWKCTYLC